MAVKVWQVDSFGTASFWLFIACFFLFFVCFCNEDEESVQITPPCACYNHKILKFTLKCWVLEIFTCANLSLLNIDGLNMNWKY